MLVSVRYEFSQRFAVPVDEAFKWAIDYDPGDWALMGLEGRRRIRKLADDAIILEDTSETPGEGPVKKIRLVRINHEKRSFSNTHLRGASRHSQFWYEFFPEGDSASRLDFTALLLVQSEKEPSEREVARIAAQERKEDSKIWKKLARAMEADLKRSERRRR